MDNARATSHGEEHPEYLLEAIHKLIQAGTSHQRICSVLGLKLEEVQHLLAMDHSQGSKLTESIKESIYCPKSPQAPQLHEDILPTFTYSYRFDSDQLHWTNLVTGEHSSHRVPSYRFKVGCCWSEVPGGSLLITGGGNFLAEREVVRINPRSEFAVSHCPPMLTARQAHTAVYHSQHLYVLEGWSDREFLSECERYVCEEDRWEALPPLPRACNNASGVVVENSLYALGGWVYSDLDLVQKLSLESLTWELMQFRLPFTGECIPCFKLSDTEVYLVVNKTLCSFTVTEVRPLKTLTEDIQSWRGANFQGREGAKGLLDYQVHFSVSHLETWDAIACKWEPELHELPSKAFQAQLLHQFY
jgi:hypothetical protein